MILSERDAAIVKLVGRFGQLAAGHVRALVFHTNQSPTPVNRVLARLTANKVLARIERRLVGGTGGGSGQSVYQLGPKGHTFLRIERRYWPYRAVNYHMLAIADAYVALKEAERAGQLKVLNAATEPDTWHTVAGAELRPDMFADLGLVEKRQRVPLFIEVDMGTERQRQIKDKLDRYAHAWRHSDGSELEVFPLVLFLTPDDERTAELRYLIARQAEEVRPLFAVENLANFPANLLKKS